MASLSRINALAGLTALLLAASAWGNEEGLAGYSNKTSGTNCNDCHTGATAPSVSLVGPTTIQGGETGLYTFVLTSSSGEQAGLDIAKSGGGTFVPGTGMRLSSAGELVQTGGRNFSGGKVTYNFSFIAPTTAGTVTLYAAGLQSDDNKTVAADKAAFTTLSIKITPPNQPPTVVTPAKASLTSIKGTVTDLTVLGADDAGEAKLIYTWASVGPAPVAFSVNSSNAAKSTRATFSRAGNYTLVVTLKDEKNKNVSSTVPVVVEADPVALTLSPENSTVGVSSTRQFIAQVRDQFGTPLATQPAMTWTVTGGGTISPTGLFTSSAAVGGPFTLTVNGGGLTTSTSLSVSTNPSPTVLTPASAAGGGSVNVSLSVRGEDDGGEPALTYSWSVSGAGSATFSANDTNAAKATVATVNRAGTYTFTATIRDALGGTVTSSVNVTVIGVLTRIDVTPPLAGVKAGASLQFTSVGVDQFGYPLSSQPPTTWTITGGGVVNASGLFTSNPTAGGPYTLTATAAGKTATASVTVAVGEPPTMIVAAIANPTTVTEKTTQLAVMGQDDGGEAALTYVWTAIGPGVVSFSPNGTNSSKNAVATFTQDGTYSITVIARDATKLTASSSVLVTVIKSFNTLTLQPSDVGVMINTSQAFVVRAVDQFNNAISAVPNVTFAVTGGGTISPSGLFVAGPTIGGPYTVTATSSQATARATVRVTDKPSLEDLEKPLIAWESPRTTAELDGTVVLLVSAIDNVGVTEVTFTLDGTPIGTVTTEPWTLQFDSTTVLGGERAFAAMAKDAAGNVGETGPVMLKLVGGDPSTVQEGAGGPGGTDDLGGTPTPPGIVTTTATEAGCSAVGAGPLGLVALALLLARRRFRA